MKIDFFLLKILKHVQFMKFNSFIDFQQKQVHVDGIILKKNSIYEKLYLGIGYAFRYIFEFTHFANDRKCFISNRYHVNPNITKFQVMINTPTQSTGCFFFNF